MLGSVPPELTNERGAQWNPPGTSALYTSLAEMTAKAEGDHVIAMQPVPPRATRTVYELDVAIKNLLDLTDAGRLAAIEITEEDFESILWEPPLQARRPRALEVLRRPNPWPQRQLHRPHARRDAGARRDDRLVGARQPRASPSLNKPASAGHNPDTSVGPCAITAGRRPRSRTSSFAAHPCSRVIPRALRAVPRHS